MHSKDLNGPSPEPGKLDKKSHLKDPEQVQGHQDFVDIPASLTVDNDDGDGIDGADVGGVVVFSLVEVTGANRSDCDIGDAAPLSYL